MSSDFNAVAVYYNMLSRIVFGNAIHKAQIQFLDQIPPDAKVLIIGGGSGRFLKELLQKVNVGNVLYLEKSDRMIQLSKDAIQGLPQSWKVEFRKGTEVNLEKNEVFDVVITNCLLNLFQDKELKALMKILDSHLSPTGIWLFSDFRISTNKFHRLWQILLLKIMYIFFRYASGLKNNKLENFDHIFYSMGFRKKEEKHFYAEMINAVVYIKT